MPEICRRVVYARTHDNACKCINLHTLLLCEQLFNNNVYITKLGRLSWLISDLICMCGKGM